jgi:S1-C subfamily serine protease
MGVLKKLFLVVIFLLLACPSSIEEIDISNNGKQLEYVSVKSNNALKKSRNSSVEVSAYDDYGNMVSGSGAYIKYKSEYFVLTAAHVVAGSKVAMVSYGKEKIIAEVFYVDEVSDMALLSLEGMFTRTALPWRTAHPEIGGEVLYTGFPNMYDSLTIEGYISGTHSGRLVMHSYAWGGASGSVVLNQHGAIIGIVSAIDIGHGVAGIPQLVEDLVIVVPVSELKIKDLYDSSF